MVVTGAAGFLGAHLVRRLAREGALVHALDRAPAQAWRRAGAWPETVARHRVDLEDASGVTRLLRRLSPRVVFHLAGRVDPARTPEMVGICLRENVLGTATLLQALAGNPPEALVFASTTDVYGQGPVPYDEAQPLDPLSPYAVSKVAAEQLCRLFRTSHGLPAVIVRLATIYGPGQAQERLIPSAIAAALADAPLAVTSGEQRRDWLFVDDAVDGLARAGSTPQAAGETINLGGPDVVSLRDTVETIGRIAGTSWEPAYGVLPRRANEPDASYCSSQKAQRLLGWRAATGLQQGLEQTIEAVRGERRLAVAHA